MSKTIDIFPHIMPPPVLERFSAVASGWTKFYMDGFRANPTLTAQWDLSERFRQMDEVEDYSQVLTLNMPPIEHIAGGDLKTEREIARLANDSLADLVGKYPDRFKGFAAALPMDDVDGSIEELERAVTSLGAFGAQIFTNANGLPLDDHRFEPLFEKLSELNCLVWVHGARASTTPDFECEHESRYGMWLSFGWPYEMGLFAGRLVLSGLFDRFPNLRMYLHHSGGMVATYCHRVGGGGFQYGPPGHEEESEQTSGLHDPVLSYFKRFYVDTSGNSPTSISAALDFFGTENVMLGSDTPFRPIHSHIEMLGNMDLPDNVREHVFHLNAERILGLA